MVRKLFLASLVVMVILAAVPARASGITVAVNGEVVPMNPAPIMENGRILVPARQLAEAMGKGVEWNQRDGMVEIFTPGVWSGARYDFIRMWPRAESNKVRIGTYGVADSAANYIIDVAPRITAAGHTYVPLRIIPEAFGCETAWSEPRQLVTVDCSLPAIAHQDPFEMMRLNPPRITPFGNMVYDRDEGIPMYPTTYRRVEGYLTFLNMAIDELQTFPQASSIITDPENNAITVYIHQGYNELPITIRPGYTYATMDIGHMEMYISRLADAHRFRSGLAGFVGGAASLIVPAASVPTLMTQAGGTAAISSGAYFAIADGGVSKMTRCLAESRALVRRAKLEEWNAYMTVGIKHTGEIECVPMAFEPISWQVFDERGVN